MTATAVDSSVVDWQVAAPQGRASDNGKRAALKEDEKKDAGSYEEGDSQPQHGEQCTVEENHEPLTPEILNRLDEARILAKDDKLLLAAHLLEGIDGRHLLPVHHEILREAALFKSLLRENTTPPDQDDGGGGWMKQGQHTGRHNFSIYYKLNGNNLSCRIETVVHSDLLVPILSVLNESELYATWLPNYSVPRLRVAKSEKWRQSGRCSQIVNVETEVPWPLATRQVIIKAVACDNIDSYPEDGNGTDCLGKEGGRIVIRIQSLDCHDGGNEGLNIPQTAKGTVRMKVGGGFTIEKCPVDHPMLEYDAGSTNPDDLVLVTFSFTVDPELRVIPKSYINFFMRTAMGTMWNMFLNIAEQIKEGKRPAHSEAIGKKRELYDWVEERTRVMLEGRVPQSS